MLIKADSEYVIELTTHTQFIPVKLFTFQKLRGWCRKLFEENKFLKSYTTFRKVQNEIYIFLQKYLSGEIIM